ncbi:MAG: MazG nucleotide pyrophosphohydrolase domain-containing protein [Nostoc sp.]|uniref:MazG nucleotide pyrophosphohydrolase domain-containing protein n=1 Tax=Nostoc sp. TaxID=1180 RepID=UPI002FF9AE15
MENQNESLAALQELIEVVAKLRSPDGGCPWDLAQTAETLTPYVIEEAYEVVDAIKSGDKGAIAEELGDLLFATIQLARWHNLDPSAALQGTNQRFVQRLEKMEAVVDRPLSDYSLNELENLWQQAKAQLAKEGS